MTRADRVLITILAIACALAMVGGGYTAIAGDTDGTLILGTLIVGFTAYNLGRIIVLVLDL